MVLIQFLYKLVKELKNTLVLPDFRIGILLFILYSLFCYTTIDATTETTAPYFRLRARITNTTEGYLTGLRNVNVKITGNSEWEENHEVTFNNGYCELNVGQQTPLPNSFYINNDVHFLCLRTFFSVALKHPFCY